MRFENSRSTTSGFEISSLTLRRAAMSPALAVVMRRSTQRRISLARASVVVMPFALSSNDVHRLRISALRWSVGRLKRRPLFWWRINELAPEDRPHLLGLDEALLDELLLDLVQRLAPEVAEREQLLLLLLQQLADGLDLVRLEAVERAHRQVELLDRRVHQPVLGALLPAALGLLLLDRVAEAHEELQVVGEQRRRGAHRLLRRHRAVGPDLYEQPVVV